MIIQIHECNELNRIHLTIGIISEYWLEWEWKWKLIDKMEILIEKDWTYGINVDQ